MDDLGRMIVVGLDHDPGAAAALRWAVGEARLRSAWVRAVYAYIEPVVADVNLVPLDSAVSLDQAQAAAEVWRDAALAGMPEADQVRLDVRATSGAPGPVLVEAAAGALMLVVGSREHHPLYRLVHGSVSRYCVSHARCPVVAVPAPEPRV